MKQRIRHPGVTLSEVLVVVAAMVLLTVLAVPATKKIVASFESASGVRKVIAAALANARAIAAREQCYAGVRFQQDLNGDQYMVFIIHDPAPAPAVSNPPIPADFLKSGTGLANGFRAVDARKPVKLPQTIGVMDRKLRRDPADPLNPTAVDLSSDANIDTPDELRDTTTFSVVFSPTGQLVIHEVRVRNRWGRRNSESPDDVFNIMPQVESGTGMFIQDEEPPTLAPPGFGAEMSRNCFVIYEKKRLEAAPPSARWTTYLHGLDMIYINPHTGELVND